MKQPELIESITSASGEVKKYAFRVDGGQAVEFSLINRGDGKVHVCVPSWTGCRMGCTFCALTDYDVDPRPLARHEITDCLQHILTYDNALSYAPVLLVSFMGAGEPTMNTQVLNAMCSIYSGFEAEYRRVRFAVATMAPSADSFQNFATRIADGGLDVKVHWSLHSPRVEVRKSLMPRAADYTDVIPLLQRYRAETGNAVEAHYALIDGVNDTRDDSEALVGLLRGTGIPLKFIEFNERPSSPLRRAAPTRLTCMLAECAAGGVPVESYCPPGADISSACGQFAAKYYRSGDAP